MSLFRRCLPLASIAQVTRVRLGSVTHSFDENPRFLRRTSSEGSFDLELSLGVSAGEGCRAAWMLERPRGGERFHVGAAERIR